MSMTGLRNGALTAILIGMSAKDLVQTAMQCRIVRKKDLVHIREAGWLHARQPVQQMEQRPLNVRYADTLQPEQYMHLVTVLVIGLLQQQPQHWQMECRNVPVQNVDTVNSKVLTSWRQKVPCLCVTSR